MEVIECKNNCKKYVMLAFSNELLYNMRFCVEGIYNDLNVV